VPIRIPSRGDAAWPLTLRVNNFTIFSRRSATPTGASNAGFITFTTADGDQYARSVNLNNSVGIICVALPTLCLLIMCVENRARLAQWRRRRIVGFRSHNPLIVNGPRDSNNTAVSSDGVQLGPPAYLTHLQGMQQPTQYQSGVAIATPVTVPGVIVQRDATLPVAYPAGPSQASLPTYPSHIAYPAGPSQAGLPTYPSHIAYPAGPSQAGLPTHPSHNKCL
jgi:hypothetical protein